MEIDAFIPDLNLNFKISDPKMVINVIDQRPGSEGIRFIKPDNLRTVPLEDLIHQSLDPFERNIKHWLALRGFRWPIFVHEIRSINFYSKDEEFRKHFESLTKVTLKKDCWKHFNFEFENLKFDIINCFASDEDDDYYCLIAEHYHQLIQA